MDDALRFMSVLMPVLWIALAVAIAVFVVALLSRVMGPIVHWLEPRVLPRLARRARARRGIAPDAPRWACRACHSVNEATAAACYRCGASAGQAAVSLPDRDGVDDGMWQPPPQTSHFDPSRYRGPGAPPPDATTGPTSEPATDPPPDPTPVPPPKPTTDPAAPHEDPRP